MKSESKIIVPQEITPIFSSLRDRLNAGRDAAEAAWAVKAGSGFRDAVAALAVAVRGFDVRVPEIRNDEDLLRLRAELAEMLRSAASAIAPRAS